MATEVGIRFIGEDQGVKDSIDEYIKKAEQLQALEAKTNSNRKEGFESSAKAADMLNTELDETVKETKMLKNEQNLLSGSLKKSIGDYKIFGLSLNGTIGKTKGFITSLKGVKAGLLSGTGALRVFKLALASTGIGLLIVGLGSLAAFLTRTQKGADKLAVASAALGAAFEVVFDVAEGLGEVLVDLFLNPVESLKSFGSSLKNFFTDPIGNAKQAIEGIVSGAKEFKDELIEEIKVTANLEKAKQSLRDSEIELRKETAQTRSLIADDRAIAADITKSYDDRIAAANRAGENERKLVEKRIELAQKNAVVIAQENKLSDNLTEDNQRLAEAEAKVAEIKLESTNLQRRLITELNTITQQQQAEIKKLNDEYQKLNSTLADDLLAIDLEQADPITRLNKQREIALQALDDQKQVLIDAAKAVNQPIGDIEASFDRLVAAANERFRRERIELDINDVVAFKTSSSQPLKIEPREVVVSPQRVEFEEDGFREAFLDVFDKIKDVFEDEDLQDFLSGFNTLFNEFAGIFTAGIDQQIADIDRLSERRREDIQDLESELETAADLREKGYEINVEGKAEELESLRAQEEADQQRKEELQAKAAQVQLIQDSISQGSSLLTASSNIYKGFTAAFPVVGSVLAIPVIAALFGAFAKLKIDAFNATRLYTGADSLWEGIGAIAPGEASDVPGRGNGLSIIDDQGNLRAKVGGNEMLWDEGISHSHGDVGKWIKANAGRLSKYDMIGLLEGNVMPMIESSGRSLGKGISRSEKAIVQRQAAMQASLTDASLIKQNKDLLDRIKDYENSKPRRIPDGEGGFIVVSRR